MGSWTKADLNRLRHQMAAQQRSIDEIAEEVRHHCGCSKLAAYHMAHGWESAEEIAKTAAHDPLTSNSVPSGRPS